MAHAVLDLFPGTKVAIGPSIKDGFYYDFDKESPFVPEDLEKIEKRMKEIVSEKEAFCPGGSSGGGRPEAVPGTGRSL
jgi:threonyl-tRNA synthetase